ncbi:class I SAM-dependent methyltransferase [Enterovirga sp. CN4-39]|uniref:class I SAM-dependent methyltransferase n=1 Tax=Enterovirga sp. CN4-39 TaxID=3400910 RepID=UPI003C05EDD3
MLQHYGSLENRTVLELGPLEGGHTYMMERAGAAKIDAIEANRLAFLRCLILKELVQLRRARFHLGNFVAWLDQPNLQYDLIVASGVLYHLRDPLHLLERAAAATDALFLWTHYVSDEAMPLGDPRRGMFRKTVERRPFRGIDVRLYPRSYQGAEAKVSFCGGIYDEHRWIQREDLLAALTALGFDSLQIAHEQTDHPNGPCFSLLARKSSR